MKLSFLVSIYTYIFQKYLTVDSSVGRAEDCSGLKTSLGRWFKSGSTEIFLSFKMCLKQTKSTPNWVVSFLICKIDFIQIFFKYLILLRFLLNASYILLKLLREKNG